MSKEYLYEGENEDFLLTEEEEKIMRAMRRVDKLWKQYKQAQGGNRLLLFCGGTGCNMRVGYDASSEIETFTNITNDGGDGGDKF